MAGVLNKRRSERLQHELLVAYRTVDGFVTDFAVNISQGGLFINTRKLLPVGSTVRLLISLPDARFPFDLTGRVIRVSEFNNPNNEVPGMGIEFLNLSDEMKARLGEFVQKMKDRLSVTGRPQLQ
jgi:uncharacterized protein (TIGR02266 family)